jgi:glutathione synthase/RimK-type ligase-like ATP-grasp enzyme
VSGVTAEHLKVGGVQMAEASGYAVIVDRISHDIPFYRSYLKNSVLTGTKVINNPFWWSADDKFFNYALAAKLGVAVPRTVLLPHKKNPTGTTDRSMRNLEYPLDWDGIFRHVGFPAFLKPHDGGGWKNVYKVNKPEELFAAYDESEQLCMTLQAAVKFQEYFPLLCDRSGKSPRDALRPRAASPSSLRSGEIRRPHWNSASAWWATR